MQAHPVIPNTRHNTRLIFFIDTSVLPQPIRTY